jgi:hypothetical protein
MVPDYLLRTQAVLCYKSGWRRAWNRVEDTPPPHTRSIRLDLLENALHSIRRVGQHKFLSILCTHLPPPASIIALFECVALADIFECGMVAGFQRLLLQAISASPLCLDLSSTRYEGSIIRCFDYVAVFCFVFWYCQCTVNFVQRLLCRTSPAARQLARASPHRQVVIGRQQSCKDQGTLGTCRPASISGEYLALSLPCLDPIHQLNHHFHCHLLSKVVFPQHGPLQPNSGQALCLARPTKARDTSA